MNIVKKNIAIFASGSGTNAEQLVIKSREQELFFKVKIIITNHPQAGVILKAHQLGIPCFYWSNKAISQNENLIEFLHDNQIDLIVLAGFLKRIDSKLIASFPNRIVNLHPALLPKFGGKGMYGKHVHEAVLAANEEESGISIHYVNEAYDKGDIIAQFSCRINSEDNITSLQEKIQRLEHLNFFQIVNQVCGKLIK